MSRRLGSAWLIVIALLVGGFTGAASTPPAAGVVPAHQAVTLAHADAAISVHGVAGLKIDSVRKINSRLMEFVFTTANLAKPTTVRVLLPHGYAHSHQRYPVLYLLDGCCNSAPQARDWTTPSTQGNAEQLTRDDKLIVVMPDCGFGGFYTNWYNNGAGGDPRWESYIIGQLLPWTDSNFRTRARRSGRAIAGLSMGGFGALSLAARHPSDFVSAASFSGVVDSNDLAAAAPAVDDGLAGGDGGIPGSLWGQRATEQVRWRGDDPWDLASNLRGMQLTLRTGNGEPGPLDTPSSDPAGSIEATVHVENIAMDNRLNALGIPHVFDNYGPGTHSWPYWNRDLRETLPGMMRTFRHPPAKPRRFKFRSIKTRFHVYGYTATMHRKALEFAGLQIRGNHTLALHGSGTAVVRTAARYRPGAAYRIGMRREGHTVRRIVRADRKGRLRLRLQLGPANTVQQYTVGANGLRHDETDTVSIRRAGHR